MKTKNKYTAISRSEIDDFNLKSNTEQNRLEKKLDSFDQDALDGFRESGLSTNSLRKLDNRFLRINKMNWWLISGLGVAAVFAISVYILSSNEQNSEKKFVEKTEHQLPEYIDSLVELPQEKQLTASVIQKSQKAIRKNNKIEEQKNETSTQIEFPENILEPLPIEVTDLKHPVSTKKTAKEVYLKDFKTIDYRDYRTRPTLPIEMTLLTGTPANFEGKAAENEEISVKTVEIPYIDYLEKSLDYVNKGKWKQALVRFEEILKNYPDDVNARFYSGMCYFNLKQYEKAFNEFSTCLQLEYSNFNEEAEWYFAKSKINAKQTEEAKKILNEIISRKGYYTKQAETLLKSLN